MTFDPFVSFTNAPGMPARQAFTVTPGVEPAILPSALYVGTGGDVAVQAVDSEVPVIYRNVPDGAYLTVRAVRVLSEGTTASDLIGEI